MGLTYGPAGRRAGALLAVFLFGLTLAAGVTLYATNTLAQSATTGSSQTDTYRASLQAQLDNYGLVVSRKPTLNRKQLDAIPAHKPLDRCSDAQAYIIPIHPLPGD